MVAISLLIPSPFSGLPHPVVHFAAVSQCEVSCEKIPALGPKKREAQRLLGRLAAARALTAAGLDPVPEIPRGESGRPLWPEGFVGSISHSGEHAIAIVARSEQLLSIGVDLEAHQPSRALSVFVRTFRPSEEAFVRQSGANWRQRALEIFSLKESIYKAAFPLALAPLRYQDVECTLVTSVEDAYAISEYRLVLQRDIPPLTRGTVLRGYARHTPVAGESAACDPVERDTVVGGTVADRSLAEDSVARYVVTGVAIPRKA